MKIIFVIVSLAGGGAERVISILANQFAKKGAEVLIMMTAGDEVAYELDPRVQLVCIGEKSGGSMRARLRRILGMRRVFADNKEAVIISFGPGTSFFAVTASLFLGHQMIISERNDPAICPHKKLRNIVYSRAQRLVFQTKEAMDCFPLRIKRKGMIVPNPVSGSIPSPFKGERTKKIVCVGRLEHQKNHSMLLDAFQIFHSQHPDYTLHLYGDGSLKMDIERQISSLGLTQSVFLEGFCSNVTEEIKDAGMYVLSSDYEGISNSLLEALALGIPVVSTDCPIGGSALCIEHGVNGLLTPVGDAQAFAVAMTKIAASGELARELSENASKIRFKYSESNIGSIWLQLIKDMINGKRV